MTDEGRKGWDAILAMLWRDSCALDDPDDDSRVRDPVPDWSPLVEHVRGMLAAGGRHEAITALRRVELAIGRNDVSDRCGALDALFAARELVREHKAKELAT